MLPPACSIPGVTRWNFKRLVDLKQCDVVQTPLLAQPQPPQLQSSAPAPATPAVTGDTDPADKTCTHSEGCRDGRQMLNSVRLLPNRNKNFAFCFYFRFGQKHACTLVRFS